MDEELRKQVERYLQQERGWEKQKLTARRFTAEAYGSKAEVTYSIAEVQLTGGRMIGMTITASPALGTHLTKSMKETGYLYLYNDSESLMIRADEVVAIKLTQMTKG